MAITTLEGHCFKALAFYNTSNMYFGIGRQTAWTDENNPDPPSSTATAVEEPVGFKRVESKYLVIPDPNGTIVYDDGSAWSIVNTSDAYTRGARWVYIDCNIKSTDLPLVIYRQVGLCINLVVSDPSYAGYATLLPNQVSSQGTLYLLDNSGPTTRKANQKETLSYILEF